MSFGNLPGGDDDEVMSEINMTPLVDVMLVLLIIFMVTMPVLTHSVKLDLPQAASAPEDVKPAHVTLAVLGDGSYRWDSETVPLAVLAERMAGAARQHPQPELHLRADRSVAYDAVAQALAAAQRAGLTRVGFVTEPGN
jgi:biopolymer transport protein ExbD